MKREFRISIIKAIIALVIAIAAALFTAFLLNVDELIIFVLLGMTVLSVLFFLRTLFQGFIRILLTIFISISYICSAFIILIYIIVIPYTYYISWIEMVQIGRPGGIISFLFFLCIAFFSSIFAGLANKAGVLKAAMGTLLIISFEMAVIFQDLFSALLFSLTGAALIVLFSAAVRPIRISSILIPLPLLAAVIIIAFLFSLGSLPGTGILTLQSLNPEVKQLIIQFFPNLPSLASLAGLGHGYKEEIMGSRPNLAKTPLFTVNSREKKILYLRTEVFDSYFNNKWFFDKSILKRKLENLTDILGSKDITESSVQVTVLFDYLMILPHLLSTRSIDISNEEIFRIGAGNMDTGFNLTLPMLKNDKIIIFTDDAETRKRSDFLNTKNDTEKDENTGSERGFGENLLLKKRIEKILKIEIETQAILNEEEERKLLSHYLVVPGKISPRTEELAARLAEGETKQWQILLNIYEYLKKNYSYSLDTADTPEHAEFVDDFLFTTKKGYSVHFATAFIILARLNNIPARYATGFFVYMPFYETQATVTGLNTHAWPEVWIDGLGWTRVEATPVIDLFTKYGSEYYDTFNEDDDDLTAQQLIALMGRHIPPPKKGETDSFWILLAVFPWAAVSITAVLLFLLAVWLFLKLKKQRLPYRGDLKKVTITLRSFVKSMEKHSVKSPEESGWIEWGTHLKKLIPIEKMLVDDLVYLALEMYFAGEPVSKENLQFVRQACRRLGTPGMIKW